MSILNLLPEIIVDTNEKYDGDHTPVGFILDAYSEARKYAHSADQGWELQNTFERIRLQRDIWHDLVYNASSSINRLPEEELTDIVNNLIGKARILKDMRGNIGLMKTLKKLKLFWANLNFESRTDLLYRVDGGITDEFSSSGDMYQQLEDAVVTNTILKKLGLPHDDEQIATFFSESQDIADNFDERICRPSRDLVVIKGNDNMSGITTIVTVMPNHRIMLEYIFSSNAVARSILH